MQHEDIIIGCLVIGDPFGMLTAKEKLYAHYMAQYVITRISL